MGKIPQMVLYDKRNCDAVVLVQRLRVLNKVKENFLAVGVAETPMIDNAIETLEDLLAEHLPSVPAERLL